MKKRIEEAVKALGFEKKVVFSVSELNQIATMARCHMFDVMHYLRFCR